jgi:hypothetical protein
MVEDQSNEGMIPPKGKTPEEKFQDEINQSIERVSKKFSKICRFISNRKIEIVNASYGITYKNIMTKFRERYKEMVGTEIDETKLKIVVDDYFTKLYSRGEKTMKRYSNILFVFSAGNSGLDNDTYHHYPSRIKVDNAITVAAMNGDYLATFSNFGQRFVDIGAPGVAILSLVPKVYSENGTDLYSPSSGTSMAAPYVSNLAAQIKNTNLNLNPSQIKKIILETGDMKDHLKSKLSSASIVDNQKALRAALLTKDFKIDQAISLGTSGVVPVEDKISFGIAPALTPEEIQQKVMESFPSVITPQEVEEEPSILEDATKSSSSLPKDPKTAPLGNSAQLPLGSPSALEKSSDPAPSSQIEEQSQKPSEALPASSSEPQPLLPEAQSQESSPSSPQL